MHLFELPKGSWFTVIDQAATPPGGTKAQIGHKYKLHRIDGMYSYCTDVKNNVVHVAAFAEIKPADAPAGLNPDAAWPFPKERSTS